MLSRTTRLVLSGRILRIGLVSKYIRFKTRKGVVNIRNIRYFSEIVGNKSCSDIKEYELKQRYKEAILQYSKQEISPQECFQTLSEIITKMPKDFMLHIDLAGFLYNTSQHDLLSPVLQKMRELSPENSIPDFFLILSLIQREKREEAEELMREHEDKLRDESMLSPMELRYKSLALSMLKRPIEALTTLKLYMDKKNMGNNMNMNMNMSNESPGPPIFEDLAALHDKMILEMEIGEFLDSISTAEEYLSKDPSNIIIRFHMAQAMGINSDLTGALREYTHIIEDNNVVDELKGRAYMERSRCHPLRDALRRVKDLELSMEIAPQLQADKEIPKVYFESNLLREASASIAHIINKYDITLDFKLCIIKAAVDRYYLYDYNSSLIYYKKALQLDPSKAEYLDKQINVLQLKIKEGEKAIEREKEENNEGI